MIVAGQAYVYHYNNTAAWDVTQMILLLNGDLDPNGIDGLDMTDWVNEVNNGTNSHSSHHDHGLEDARSFVQHMVGEALTRGIGMAVVRHRAKKMLPTRRSMVTKHG